jgi:hypothetical protein
MLTEVTDTAGEDKIACFKAFLEGVQEFAPEHLGQNLYGTEELFPGRNPVIPLRRQSSSGNNTMDMRMAHEVLSPGVQDCYEADPCAEMLWIVGEFYKGLGDRAKEKIVDDLLIHDDQRIQL